MSRNRKHALWRSALLLAAALALAGCQLTGRPAGNNITTGSVDPAAAPSVKELLRLRRNWTRNPADKRTGLALFASLKRLGQTDAALDILKRLVSLNPKDAALRYQYGIELMRANRPVPAEDQFRRLLAAGAADWKVRNALGTALAAQGRHAAARMAFNEALRRSPGNVEIINNMAMSHIMEGQPKQAERLLKQALTRADARVAPKLRQNLALALGLQGRFQEARRVASHDLPPAQVEANMAYLKRMLGSGQTWEKIANGSGRS